MMGFWSVLRRGSESRLLGSLSQAHLSLGMGHVALRTAPLSVTAYELLYYGMKWFKLYLEFLN